eukprot:GHUV01027180.1.p1 GENE.GHUV01027180.1~~GHUV01027180.1.p1  ORF type:complete len:358 (+),score=108.30 GHUV01027180.1:410-1483(+)
MSRYSVRSLVISLVTFCVFLQAVPRDVSARILREARAQQDELDAEDQQTAAAALGSAAASIPAGAIAAALQQLADSDSECGDDGFTDAGSMWGGDDDDVSPADEAALAAFMSPAALDGSGAAEQKTLADAIMARLQQQQQQQQPGTASTAAGQQDFGSGSLAGLDDAVIDVYRGVGQLLARYTTGKVPKAFKIIPNLVNWEEILQLTDPEHWSPHAMYVATKMFVSNLNARLAQRFLALVLLPRVRRDIAEHKRLHFALFQALKKSTYKAGAFYKVRQSIYGCNRLQLWPMCMVEKVNRLSFGADRLRTLPHAHLAAFYVLRPQQVSRSLCYMSEVSDLSSSLCQQYAGKTAGSSSQ